LSILLSGNLPIVLRQNSPLRLTAIDTTQQPFRMDDNVYPGFIYIPAPAAFGSPGSDDPFRESEHSVDILWESEPLFSHLWVICTSTSPLFYSVYKFLHLFPEQREIP
jgi:hypothetical protein